ncbi:hypothetical protein V3C99_018782 [Haemonchus contortus]
MLVMALASSKEDLGKTIMELQSFLTAEDLGSKCVDLARSIESFATILDPDYSSIAGELNVDEDVLRRVVHHLVKIAVNIGSTESAVEDVIDNLPVRSFLEEDTRLLICKSVRILREHPENLSSLIRHQIRSHTGGNYVDSSIRFDRNISQRTVYETEGERCFEFLWRVQLSDSKDVVVRLPYGALEYLAKQCDLISDEINRIRQRQSRQTHPHS